MNKITKKTVGLSIGAAVILIGTAYFAFKRGRDAEVRDIVNTVLEVGSDCVLDFKNAKKVLRIGMYIVE